MPMIDSVALIRGESSGKSKASSSLGATQFRPRLTALDGLLIFDIFTSPFKACNLRCNWQRRKRLLMRGL